MTLVVETFDSVITAAIWTAPSNIVGDTLVETWGQGTGGGGGSTTFGGGAGAGGGYAGKTVTALPGDTITYRNGAGGAGGTGNAAGNGGTAGPITSPSINAEKTTGSFTLSLVASAGTRGLRATTVAPGGAGIGGPSSGGDTNTTGQGGAAGSTTNGGNGGDAGNTSGTGGPGGATLVIGTDGAAPGGGGGGGGNQKAGGRGANGRIQFTYNIADISDVVHQRGFIANMGRFMNC